MTEQVKSIKDLLHGCRRNSWGAQLVIPSGRGSSLLPARVAHHTYVIVQDLIHLAPQGASHIIKSVRKQPQENTRADWLKIVFLLNN